MGFGFCSRTNCHPDDLVLGGGNSKKLKELPPRCRLGGNDYAFTGGFRLWEPATVHAPFTTTQPVDVNKAGKAAKS
jgi:hypothetical protein